MEKITSGYGSIEKPKENDNNVGESTDEEETLDNNQTE